MLVVVKKLLQNLRLDVMCKFGFLHVSYVLLL